VSNRTASTRLIPSVTLIARDLVNMRKLHKNGNGDFPDPVATRRRSHGLSAPIFP
jgi:hypothetical protein